MQDGARPRLVPEQCEGAIDVEGTIALVEFADDCGGYAEFFAMTGEICKNHVHFSFPPVLHMLCCYLLLGWPAGYAQRGPAAA